MKCIKHLWEIISSASLGFYLKFLCQTVNDIWQFYDLGRGAFRIWGVRDRKMLIKVKKITWVIFAPKHIF